MRLRTESLDIQVCQDFKSRLIGLYKSQPLGRRDAVWLSKCRYVHTFGMREPLSLIFLNGLFKIVDRQICAKPCRVYGTFEAQSVIEMSQRTEPELDRICEEITLLSEWLDASEHFYKGRIKAGV